MLTPTRTAVLLHEYLSRHGAAPFDWGINNCCHWAAGWMRHATGIWPMQGLPETPTPRAARRLVRQLGGTLAAAWTRQLGRAPLPALQAQLGDLVLVPVPAGAGGTGEAVGVCTGRHAVCIGTQGLLAHVEMQHCTHAWRLWPDPQQATVQ